MRGALDTALVGRRVTATSDPAQGNVLEVIISPILLAMIYLIEPEPATCTEFSTSGQDPTRRHEIQAEDGSQVAVSQLLERVAKASMALSDSLNAEANWTQQILAAPGSLLSGTCR